MTLILVFPSLVKIAIWNDMHVRGKNDLDIDVLPQHIEDI